MMITHHREWTVRDYAQREQVSTRTVWTWIAKGAVETRRTPGRQIRILTPTDEPDVKIREVQGSSSG